MSVGGYVDGDLPDWDAAPDDRCLCDIRAALVCLLSITRGQFEEGVRRLSRRRAARSQFVRGKLERRKGAAAMQVVDDKLLFEINNEFEDVFGREPLEAFVTDIDEIVHERLGAFFDIVTDSRAMTSPMAAGRAFRIAPARSYPDVSALAREAARKVANPKWRPSVRVEVNFVIAGEIEAVRSLAGEFVPMMSGCGALAEFSTSFRKPDLAGIPHRRPVLTLASVATSGAGKAG